MPSPTPVAALFAFPLLCATAVAQPAKALFHAPLVNASATSRHQALLDFDGDGDLDILGTRTSGSSSVVHIKRNDAGAFTEVWSTTTLVGDDASLPVAIADFDGDGRDDFVLAARGAAVRFLSQPGLTFVDDYFVQAVIVAGHRDVATGDFDGDGQIDIAVAAEDDGSTLASLDVFLATGATLTVAIPASLSSRVRLEALDLDGQGGLDLLYSDRDAATAHAYVIVGGQLQLAQSFDSQLNYLGSTPWSWTGGDVDNDGDTDLVCFRPELGNNGVQRYRVFRRTGPATFAAEADAVGGPAERLVDIDGDGDLDGVGYGVNPWAWTWSGPSLEIAINDGSGAFASAWRVPGTGAGELAGVADVDDDGDLDIVASQFVFYGDGPWDREPMPTAMGANATIVVRDYDFADVDGDGDLDIYNNRINRGDGVWTMAQPALVPPAGFTFGPSRPVDVDGDGTSDLVVPLRTGSPPVFQQLGWLRNNGSNHYYYAGTCAAPGFILGDPTVSRPDDGLSVDLDGDGDEDHIYNSVVSSVGTGSSQVYWNTDGQFSVAQTFPTFAGGRVDLVADFDGDGLMDLVMTGNQNGLHVRRGGASPTVWWQTAWTSPALPYEPAACAMGDVDDDGRIDFVRPNANGELVLFVNTSTGPGDIGFTAHTLVGASLIVHGASSTAEVRSTVAIDDFDQDGRTDIVVGRIDNEPNVCLVLRRQTWSNPPTLADYDVVRQVMIDGFAHDADGDGDRDIIGTCLVRNRRWHGAAAGRRVQRYLGTPGEDGVAPLLGSSGPFRAGETEILRLRGVPGPTVAIVGISLGDALIPNVPFPGLSLYLDLGLAAIGSIDVTEDGLGHAAASASLPIPLVQGLQGFSFFVQAFVFDPSAPQLFTNTNLLEKNIGI